MATDEEYAEFLRSRAEMQADLAGLDGDEDEDEGAGDGKGAEPGFLGASTDEIDRLASDPSSRWHELASELAVARAERQAQAEKDALAKEAQLAIDAELVDYNDPEIQAGLREQVRAKREADEREYLVQRKRELEQAGFAPESVNQRLANEQMALSETSWFGAEDLHEHPAYREYVAEKRGAERSKSFVADYESRGRTVMDDLADAEAYIGVALARAGKDEE